MGVAHSPLSACQQLMRRATQPFDDERDGGQHPLAVPSIFFRAQGRSDPSGSEAHRTILGIF